MMNIKLLLVAISTAFLGLISSCDTQKQPEYACTADNSVLFPNDPKERLFFKTGSYWIYENENNPSIIDSCYVVEYFSMIEPIDPEIMGSITAKKCYEYLHMKSHSLRFGSLYTGGGVKGATEGFNYNNEFFSVRNSGIQTDNIQFCMLDLKGTKYKEENCEYNSVYFTDSLIVKGQSYKDLLTIQRKPGNEGAYISIWYAKNIGPVKIIRRDGSTWNLTRFKVIQ